MQTLCRWWWWWNILGLVALDATSVEPTVKISQRKTRSGHTSGFYTLPARSVEELVALALEDFKGIEYDFVDKPVLDPQEDIAGPGPSMSTSKGSAHRYSYYTPFSFAAFCSPTTIQSPSFQS
ncbi:hypothetical protein F5878DRAFT_32410 [Lentinula raphanica]|uniref:Uncharacterized protein n=1 Tax=Lentinula raphanica TaxID=153919 RepID=A0AA38UAN3_9AGAR|nr:hypothetical protein F5878DRAFT_32410 [Lentinula raphanica]